MSRVLTLGEIMLRLSTNSGVRLSDNYNLKACYGGGEANVGISLANFGHEVIFASKVPNHALGLGAIKHLRKFNVDCSQVLLGGNRIGTYYLEQGVGLKASEVIYDRAFSSFSMMEELEWNFDDLFKGVELFHISGITPALSSYWNEWLLTLAKEAKKRGILVSFDVNYRSKLWSMVDCRRFVQQILPYVDYCSAGKKDAICFFDIQENEMFTLKDYYQEVMVKYPNLKVIYSTSRKVYNTSHNNLKGHLFAEGKLYDSNFQDIPQIVDRIGGGDAFAAGVIHGLLSYHDYQQTIEFATLASALKHSIFGDCNQFTEIEIENFLFLDNMEIKR